MSTKPVRLTDGYTEVGAIPREVMVELYVSLPDSEEMAAIHISARLGFRLGLWLIKNWIIGRLCGLRDRAKLAEARKQLHEIPDVEYDET